MNTKELPPPVESVLPTRRTLDELEAAYLVACGKAPKFSLDQLDKLFLKDIDDASLNETERVFAGRCHQLLLLVSLLLRLRSRDLESINKQIQVVCDDIRSLSSALQLALQGGEPPGAPAVQEDGEEPPAEPTPAHEVPAIPTADSIASAASPPHRRPRYAARSGS